MRGFLAGVVVTLLVLATSAYAVAYFGLYPMGADNPPSRLESTLSMRALDVYADRHKPDLQNPVPITADSLTEGAKEYEEHCAFCHGGAKARVSPMQHKFNPPVPQVLDDIPDDPDNWLFWVIKHGVRMTGMPAWDGIMSDDEIWKVIAFIKHSDQLPPETAAAWQSLASEPTEMDEHTPGQHEHAHEPGEEHEHGGAAQPGR
jgi:mono/diheme cytochrome c family protein